MDTGDFDYNNGYYPKALMSNKIQIAFKIVALDFMVKMGMWFLRSMWKSNCPESHVVKIG